MSKTSERICKNGHKYYKSSDCPVCPICENEQKPEGIFLTKISAPARRALEREEITSLEKLSNWSKKELLTLHGIGPTAIPILEKELIEFGLNFCA